MATFRYSAISSDGRTVRGSLEAGSQPEALEELRRRNLMPLKVDDRAGGGDEPAGGDRGPRGEREERKAAAPKPAGGGGLFAPKPGVRKHEEVVIFTRQLATMISAGIPMLESLEILQEQAESKEFGLLLTRVIDEVRSGQDLSTAIGRYPKVFTDVYVSMIKAGEASGQIDEILVRLADYMEAAERLKRDIKSAMTYPVVSLVMITGITAFLMLAIVPKFKEVFSSLGVELPGLTKAVLGASDFTRENWLLMLVGLVLAGFGLGAYKRTERGGWQWDWLMLKVPVFGPLFRKVGLSRFSKTFSTMLKSGVPILGALDIVADTSGNRVIRDAVVAARESVRQGESLAKPLGDSDVFPPMVTRMIGIGEKTGSLEQLLEKISEFYDEQVRATVKQLTSLIEPIMISVMGLMVGTIVLSVFLPIFELQKQLAAR